MIVLEAKAIHKTKVNNANKNRRYSRSSEEDIDNRDNKDKDRQYK